VEHAREEYEVSERRACRVVRQWRGTQRYLPLRRTDEDQLTQAILALAVKYVRVLKETETEDALSAEELASLVSRQSSGKTIQTIYIVRNNELAQKALSLIHPQDEVAAHYRAHPELCTTFERSDKSTFVSGI
jgi:alpha-D-ribose 1-methylphosphonate 5-triphosphate synthase subunit PhnI